MTSIKTQQDLDVILNDTFLDRVTHAKCLGVLIDQNLTWKYHIYCVSITLSRNIDIINKLIHLISDRILLFYLRLIMVYSVGRIHCKAYLDKLIKLQKWSIRTISNSHYRSHTPLFAKYSILDVKGVLHLWALFLKTLSIFSKK